MGCTLGAPIEKANEEDIVGGVGRTTQQVKVDTIPEEREAMVALEVAASRRTMYRKKMRKFHANGDLDYQSNHNFCHLRNLLDEPVGRFYLREFSQEKKLPEFKQLVDFWDAVHKLKAPKEIALVEVMRQAEIEDKQRAEAVRNGEDPATLGNDDSQEISGTVNSGPTAGAITEGQVLLYGYNTSFPTDEEVVEATEEILKTYLKKEGNQAFLNTLGQEAVAECIENAEAALKTKDVDGLRNGIFVQVQNNAFEAMINNGYHSKFREHSEYKRYKMKFAKVYNTISHRDFDFMATLGKGSFGRVIRVKKKTTRKQYALKVMSKKKILSGAESAEQVTIERNVLVTCDSPSIVKVAFTFQTSRALFLALELLDGGTLLDAIKAHDGSLPIAATRIITAQLILGLEHLHRHGILYRDLKPVNVMLDRHGNAVITDMGLCAKFRDSEFPKDEGGISNSGHRLVKRRSMPVLKPSELKCVGTYGFRAPEVLSVSEMKKGYGPPVDYWALGVTVHYMLFSKLPFSKRGLRKSMLGGQLNPKEQEKRLHKEPLNLDSKLDPNVSALIEGLLDHDPEQRLGTDLPKLKAHPFFENLDFDKLDKREIAPAYAPKVPKYPRDEKPQFDGLASAMSQFSNDNVLELFGGENEMQDEYTHVGRSQQKLFREWDYLPDRTLAADWKLANEDVLFE